MSYSQSNFSTLDQTDSFVLYDCVSNENLLNDSTKTLGDCFEYQIEISHAPEAQVRVELESHNLQENKLKNDNILTIKQCLEYGEGKFLKILVDYNFSSHLKDFYKYPICSPKFYT